MAHTEAFTPSGETTAVILAGGTSRRFGAPGEDKLDASLDGRSVLETTVENVPGWPVVIVGPPRESLRTARRDPPLWVREEPPLGGPAAALIAALPRVETEWCATIAGDIPFGGHFLPTLLDAARDAGPRCDGAQASLDGRSQPLLAVYRVDSLRGAAAKLPSATGVSMRTLLGPLDLLSIDLAQLTGSPRDALDIDTLDDLETHRRRRDALPTSQPADPAD